MGSDYKMDLYVNDFLIATLDMTGPEAAAYLLTLTVAWAKGASLPKDPDVIRRMIRYDPDEWARVWPAIEAKWRIVGDHRENGRQRLVRTETNERIAMRSQAGRKGNKVRWGERSQTDPDGIANSSPSPSPSPSPSEEKKTKRESARFVAPTVEEVRAYASEKGLTLNADYFVDHYETKDWITGRTKMRSWRAAARNAARDGWTTRNGPPSKKKLELSPEDELYREAEVRTRKEMAETIRLRKEKGLPV